MKKGHEEVLTNQVGRRKGTPWEMPTASSLVAAMSIEELRLYNQIPIEISLETLDGAATTTVGEADNVVYFTKEQVDVGFCPPIPSFLKQFLPFTRAPPILMHPNVFRILMGCSVLNSLY